MTDRELLEIAVEARKKSYSPYSGFRVGAALLGKSGKIYTGCNVENASYSATCCAERTAMQTAIAAGKRQFVKIAIVGAPSDQEPTTACMPCGVCRQFMREFCDDSFEIIVEENGFIRSYTLAELLPSAFSGSDLV